MKPEDYCEKFEQWAQACMTDLPADDEHMKGWREEFRQHYQFIYTAIKKSNLLSRLIYEGEKIRTKPCPIHQGRWSGWHYPEVCPHGCDFTGWIKEES